MMKQSTSFAQVATNLLNVLQGYTKSIRFVAILTMLLSLGIGQVWGAEVFKETFKNSTGTAGFSGNAGNGTFVADNTGWTTQNPYGAGGAAKFGAGKKIGEAETPSINCGIGVTSATLTFKSGAWSGDAKTLKLSYTNCSGAATVTLKDAQWSEYTVELTNITGNIKIKFTGNATSSARFFLDDVVVSTTDAPTTYTVTYNKNGATSGTVPTDDTNYTSGTTVTVKHNSGNLAKIGYTFGGWNTKADGTGTNYTAGSGTFKITGNTTLYAKWNLAAKYTVTWDVNGDQSVTTQVTEGSKPTFPATPSSCDATSTTFYGWATATWDGKIDNIIGKTIYTSANDMPAVNGAVTYYAVFAKKETSGSGTAGWNTVTSPADLEVGATYAISNEATNGTYLSTWDGGNNFDGSTSTICPLILGGSEGAWTFQIADGSTYNNYYLTATSQSNNRLKAVSILDEQCQFSISFDNNISNITCTTKTTHNILRYNPNGGSPIFACYSSGQSDVYLQKYSTGSTTTYSDYITTCTTETSYSVTYNGNGNTSGSVPEDNTEYKKDDQVTVLGNTGNLAKTGYTFSGWNTEANGTGTSYSAEETFTITKDIILYAQWTANTNTSYVVKHYKQALDGSYPAEATETENLTGTTDSKVTPSVKSYEGFTAPTPKQVTIVAAGSLVVEYQYTRNSYKLTWDVNKGNDLTGSYTSGSVKYEAPITKPANPTREGHGFNGWHNGTYIVTPATTMPANDLTYTAQWTPNVYTITLHTNDGTINSGEITEYTYGVGATLPTDITKGNLEFAGWYDNETCDGSPVTTISTTDTGNKVFWAKWEKATPTFAWSADSYTAALEADNTFPTLSNPNSLSVTYTSSDENVAKIDANGNIVLGSEGRTTITAIGAESATHKSATANYTLNVAAANCKWVETEIGEIEPEDEVLVTMKLYNGDTYTLDHSKFASEYPPAVAILVNGNEATFLSTSHKNSIWNISGNATDGYILRPNGDSKNALYCTSTKYNVKVGTNNDNTFIIDGGYLKNTIHQVYVGVYNSSDWRHYPANTDNAIANQTLKFYKRECLDATNYWVTWDAGEGAWEDKSSKKIESYEVGAAITKPADPTREGYRFNGWTPTPGTMPAQNTTFTAQWAELHTITWMVGSSNVLTEEVANGTGVTLTPTNNPEDGAIGSCANKFMGWSETPLGSAEGQSAPSDLCSAADMKSKHSNVTGDKTFYAVFATAEETTGGTVDATLSFASTAQRTSWSKSQQVWTQNGVTFTHNKAGGSDIVYNYNPIRCYKNSSVTITHTSNEITKIVFDCNGTNEASHISDLISPLENSGTGTVTRSDDIITITFNESKKSFTLNLSSGQVRLDGITVTAGGGTITTYSNYVTNCCNTPAPTNGAYTSVSGTEIKLTWDDAANTNRYHITGGNLSAEGVYETNKYYNITGLTECEEYTFNVSAYPEDGCESAAIQISAQPFSGAKTVNYDYNSGTGSPASFTTSCDNQKIFLPNATRPGYTFNGWFDAESGGNRAGGAGEEYNPTTSPVTLHAQWTEDSYTLTHSGDNYTITENKTSIKSSETPFTLHYTCTGDYGLPATISITGGGKSWTVGTDYTWEVAADKQSATLTINQTTITADVTITINVATRYTVTFVHNDKGVFTGSETLEVLSSENTITLPTVTDVSCGFYDTFEGWIVANEDYTESTSKPAGTIYKGGANYTVNGDCTLRALYSKCEGDNKEVYVKVIENLDDWSGTYLIVNETNNVVMDGSKTTETGLIAQNNCQNITINNNQIESNNQNDTYTFTIAPHTTTNGKYSIKSYSGYYIGSNSASNTINATTTESTYSNSITITDGILTIGCGKYKDSDASKEYRLMYMHSGSGAPVFKYYPNTQGQVCLYKKGTLCTKYYSTNPSCEKPVGVHIVYNANAADANMSCTEQNRTYKVENEVNKYPQLASQLQFCTNATREGYTLVGWNTQANGQGTTYNINQNYYNLPVSGELDGEKWITLNLYAMWKPCIKFNLGNAIGGTGVPDAVVENGECVLPEPTAEQLGTIPCGYEFYAWSETSITPTQAKPALLMPGDTYTGSAFTLYAVYRWCEGNTGSDTYYFTFNVNSKTYCITQKHNSYARFVVEEATTGLVFGLENGYLYYLDENGVKNYVYYEGSSTTVTTTTTYPNTDTQKTTFVEGDNGTTIVEPAINNGNRTLKFTGTGNLSDDYDRAYYTASGTNPTLVEVQTTTCTYATNPTCYTNTNLHFVSNGGTLNYPTDYDEKNYLELTPGTTIFLPTATFAGEWTFEGWKRGSQLESQTVKPDDPSFYPVTLNTTQFEVDDVGDIYFYAVYSKTNDDKQFDPVNGGTYKLFAIGADDTKTYMPIWSGGRGTPSGVTTCAEAGDYTITLGTGEHAGQYQITCGEYTLGVQSDADTDLKEDEGIWWNIEQSTSGKGTWRITVVGSSNRALSALSNSFGNYSLTQINNAGQTQYRDMEIGECIYTEYTSTPENIPYITITGTPVKITSTNGERVYAPTTLHIEAHNFTGERIIHLSATNGFGVDPVQVRTNGQGAYSGNVKVYYEPTTDGDGQTITTSVLTASQTGGTNAEKINQTFAAIQGRNMPANFVIAAKWDGHWYALPANCTSSLSSTEGLLIEVNDMDNPTIATAAPASAKYGLREVIPSRQTDHGQGIVFTERFAKDDKQFALYNGSNANIQVNAQYSNYAASNPDKYEWIPTTNDFNEYTLTNASTGRNLGLTSGSFGAYTAASNRVYLLPATFYEPAPVQVLKWKKNSVIVMYTGAETTATTQVGNNAVSATQTLADQQLTHGIYELTTNLALTNNAGGALKLNFGANTRVELEIPLIISGEVTASANAHDVVILENSKLTAAETKYSYKDVYVYGGAKLAIPENTELGVNNIILRAGGVATDGAGQNATYQYIYPQVELKGTLTSSVQNIRYEYVTDYDHWYHLALPFDGSLASIHYPYEYYGDQVKLDNTGSWQIKRYAGEIRATGNYNAWVDIETEGKTSTTAGQGYIFWGAPKKVSVNGGASTRQKWGIQRITMSVTAPNAMTAENGDKAITGLSSHKDVANNSGKVNDQGWNLIGNPYMVNLTGLNSESIKPGKLVEVEDAAGNWTGQWKDNEDGFRYVTIPSDHFDTYTAQRMTAFTEANPMIAGRAFFIQLEDDDAGVTFSAANRASLLAARVAANEPTTDIETGIVLSNETLQDEVNFWIKDGKTNDYEYNADYPKTPNNTNFNIYGVHTNGNLSWVAINPILATESMPIGYQVPAAGTYMLSLSETYYSEDLESLYLTDHAMSPEVTVDLINAPYEFSVNQAETNNERFTISLKLKSENQGPTTGWENIDVGKDQSIKFIHQDRLYILRNGIIYDATGQPIQTINK